MWRRLRQLTQSYSFLADGRLREHVDQAADQMPQRMAAERVAAEQHHVHQQHQRADADAEAVVEPQRLPHVVRQKHHEQQREIQEVAMDVLQDQREVALAPVVLARLADGAVGRIGPEGFVVGAAIVIAGEAEAAGKRQDEHGRGDEARQEGGHGAEPGASPGWPKSSGEYIGER